MNRNVKSANPQIANRQIANRRGVALVLVLGLLVIIVGLAVAFLSRVTIERGASASYAANASTRQLADTAVNLVQGQIHHASTMGNNVAWASQPGMIRTFGAGSAGSYSSSSNSLLNFKLYSAPEMVTTATTFAGDAPPAGWAAEKGLWSDLNAPVRGIYPILAPQPASGGAEEFSLPAPATTVPGSTTPVPMPVRWLYVLQSGELVAPGGSGDAVTVGAATASTGTNPVVGRIAFWTDDETCKVNINTASEGVFWDMPRADSAQERALARFQPAQKEFQRYPGHPAMTSLKAVFPSLTSDQIYAIVPRVVGGGSAGGTAVPSSALTPDSDRLYATVDELVFQPGRADNVGLTQARLEQARFFLTASSRAPEVTLFNTPRVSIWPIDANAADAYRPPFDRLIAFCSSINGLPYYFQRQDPKSATGDAAISRNMSLYGYLQKLTDTPFPGFGTPSFAEKFGDDRDQILTEIFDYVRMTNLDDSGVVNANRFSERAQVAPGGNWTSPGFGQVAPLRIGSTQGVGRFPVISEAGIQFIATANGKKPDGTLGDATVGNDPANKTLGGALLTLNQRRIEALFFLETFIAGQGWPPVTSAYSMRIRGLQQFEINGTSLGFPADDDDLSKTSGSAIYHGRSWGGSSSHRLALTGARLPIRGVMPADAGVETATDRYPFVSVPITIDATAGTMSFTGGTLTIEIYQRTSDSGKGYAGTAVPINTYEIEVPSGTFPIPALVTTGNTAGDANHPATVKENWWTFSRDGNGLVGTGRLATIHADFVGDNAGTPFRAEDVVRTVVPSHSDFRLFAAAQNIPATAFQIHPNYTGTATNLAHSVVEASLSNAFNGVVLAADLLAPGVAYAATKKPDVAIYHAAAASGDWDNGVSITVDGPYINKPDEGNSLNLDTGKTPYFDSSESYANSTQAMFSPNRQVPSAGMFGSLPSGVKANAPYRTLLFRPQSGHFGDGGTKDHLWTDLFWMPIVEPYAISEPFSTAGKLNMNYQIVPFNYIRRATGMAALLRSEKIMAVANGDGGNYKTGAGGTAFRKEINIPETLSQFDAKFATGSIFRSASEIMELHLVPAGSTLVSMSAYWSANKLTGDNSRERPYTNILGRLTTKSNTYTVHYRVQTLKSSSATTAGQWNESKDKITGEFRGSTTIERYITPNDAAIPPYGSSASPATETPLGNFYKWRVVNTRKFAP